MREHRSSKDRVRVVAGLIILVMLVRADFCEDRRSPPPDPEDTVRIQVTLANLDTQNIHILVGDEDFNPGARPAGNQIAPGSRDSVEVGPFRVGDVRSFSAGRSEEIFDTASCRVTNTSFTSKRA